MLMGEGYALFMTRKRWGKLVHIKRFGYATRAIAIGSHFEFPSSSTLVAWTIWPVKAGWHAAAAHDVLC
jgi:hypothetical protein